MEVKILALPTREANKDFELVYEIARQLEDFGINRYFAHALQIQVSSDETIIHMLKVHLKSPVLSGWIVKTYNTRLLCSNTKSAAHNVGYPNAQLKDVDTQPVCLL